MTDEERALRDKRRDEEQNNKDSISSMKVFANWYLKNKEGGLL